MAITDAEIESLRYHLNYGNITAGGYPYTPDGFLELFRDVIQPNLSGSTETTATTAIVAGATTAVTPVAMTGIVVNARLVVDVGDLSEIVTAKSVTLTTFTAVFANAHPASGYPIALLGGQSRLRYLLGRADAAEALMLAADVGASGGLKAVDKGDVEWFQPGTGSTSVLGIRKNAYKAIVQQLSSLVRVPPAGSCGDATQVEVY